MDSQSPIHRRPTKGVHASADHAYCAEILSFDNFRKNFTSKLTLKNWFLMTSHQNVRIFSVDEKPNGNLSIRNTISIDIELMVKVYGENDHTLFSLKLYSWSQLCALIEQFSGNVKEECGDAASVTDENLLHELSSEDKEDNRIDQETDAVIFEFCATNGVNDFQKLSTSIVKIEPIDYILPTDYIPLSDDALPIDGTLDSHNTFLYIKNETEEVNEVTVKQDRLKLGRRDANNVIRTCTICDKDFATKKKYRNHMYLHDRSKFKECDICNATCFNIRRHIETVHKNVRKEVCYICGAAYKQLSSLKGHMESKHNQSGDFFCDICKNGRNYRTKTLLKSHMTNVHIKPPQQSGRKFPKHECIQCNQKLASKHTLQYHLAAIHGDGKQLAQQFCCNTCGKVFKRKQSLTIHKRLHSRKK